MPTFIKNSTSAGMSLGKWMWKNKFLIILILAYIPILLTAIHVSQENNYPTGQYILVQSGLSIANADSQLYEKVTILEDNPKELVGMDKPPKGFFKKVKYSFKVARVVWLLLGLVSLITLPFAFFFFLFNKGNESTKTRSFIRATITFVIFIVFINLIIMVVNMSSGNNIYQIDKSLNFYQKSFQVIKLVLPFHGFGELIKYIITLIV